MKWVLLKNDVQVHNVIVPGTDLFKTIVEGEGFTIKEEEDDVPVAPNWEYNAELDAYFDPNA